MNNSDGALKLSGVQDHDYHELEQKVLLNTIFGKKRRRKLLERSQADFC